MSIGADHSLGSVARSSEVPSIDEEVRIRKATPADRGPIVALLSVALGWGQDDRYLALFDWKHRDNVFGPTGAWVAQVRDEIVGYRGFMRWEFTWHGERVRAVRAVDTATHPGFRRRGIFERLTRHALDELRDEGVGFVFNTPNAQSGAGYLKMGWQQLGRVPIAVRPRSLGGMARMATARTRASRWPESVDTGMTIDELLADEDSVCKLLGSLPGSHRLSTPRTSDYLRWRYGNALLGYRCVTAPDGAQGGIAVFRVRRRGHSREAALCELLVPDAESSRRRALASAALRAAKADYLICVQAPGERTGIPLPRQGPLLTWRALAITEPPPLRDWQLALGEVELF